MALVRISSHLFAIHCWPVLRIDGHVGRAEGWKRQQRERKGGLEKQQKGSEKLAGTSLDWRDLCEKAAGVQDAHQKLQDLVLIDAIYELVVFDLLQQRAMCLFIQTMNI